MEEMEDTLLALVMALKVRITFAHSLHRYHLAIHVARHLQKCTSPLNRCLFHHSCPDRLPTYPLTPPNHPLGHFLLAPRSPARSHRKWKML
jgi:hypothetical protein